MDPPLLNTYWLRNNRLINMTNEEATQALTSLGQVVVNLSVLRLLLAVPLQGNLEHMVKLQFTKLAM
jgi:hypothetical protein